jgi:hypothetical protein
VRGPELPQKGLGDRDLGPTAALRTPAKTRKPSRARASADARPIPVELPVTTAARIGLSLLGAGAGRAGFGPTAGASKGRQVFVR